jgi:hypothetical protein
MVIKLLGQQTF